MQFQVAPNTITCPGHQWRCALGRGGVATHKVEGDGVTPLGTWALGRVFYRPDRIQPPATGLDVVALKPDWGWCDAPNDPHYNQLITLPYAASHEILWRDDPVYDVVVEILYNVDPVQAGLGSAIFMHIAKPGYAPTEGCIALAYQDLLDVLQNSNPGDAVVTRGPT